MALGLQDFQDSDKVLAKESNLTYHSTMCGE